MSKLKWTKLSYGWKGSGQFRDFLVVRTAHNRWLMRVFNPQGEEVDLWAGRTLEKCKSQAGLIEQQLKTAQVKTLIHDIAQNDEE